MLLSFVMKFAHIHLLSHLFFFLPISLPFSSHTDSLANTLLSKTVSYDNFGGWCRSSPPIVIHYLSASFLNIFVTSLEPYLLYALFFIHMKFSKRHLGTNSPVFFALKKQIYNKCFLCSSYDNRIFVPTLIQSNPSCPNLLKFLRPLYKIFPFLCPNLVLNSLSRKHVAQTGLYLAWVGTYQELQMRLGGINSQ